MKWKKSLRNRKKIDEFYARARDPENPPVRWSMAVDQQAVLLIFLKQYKSSYKQQYSPELNDYTDRQQQTTTGLKKKKEKKKTREIQKKSTFLPWCASMRMLAFFAASPSSLPRFLSLALIRFFFFFGCPIDCQEISRHTSTCCVCMGKS